MTALETGLGVIAALDANDAEAVRGWFAPGGTWWVDCGLDRASGDRSTDPGQARPWPLHGLMPAEVKCDLLRGLPERFPGGCRQHVRRAFSGGDVAVVEVEGAGLFLGERPYRNRYCFVVETVQGPDGGRVAALREYLDTAHSAAVFEGRDLDRRSEAARLTADERHVAVRGPLARLALDFLGAVEAGDARYLLGLCVPDATWWADGGRERTAGPEAEVDAPPELPVTGRARVSDRAARIGDFAATYPAGFRLVARRVVVDDAGSGLVVVEARGEGRHRSGRLYQNRYAFVLGTTPGPAGPRVSEVREYCDTRHAFDVYGIDR